MNVGRVGLGLVVFLVVAAVVFGGWYLVDNVFLEGGRQAREAEAAQGLKGLGTIVIVEPDSKRASTVNFCAQPITAEHLSHLKNLHRLGTLLANGSELPEGFMDTVAGLGSINSLAISDTKLSVDDLNQIKQLSNLDSLYLKKVAVKDENLDAISSLSGLKILDLSDTQITDAGLAKLVPLQGLHWLLLSGTQVTDEGVVDLSKIPLKRITLFDTVVTPEAVKKLQEQLPDAKIELGNRPAEEIPPAEEPSSETGEQEPAAL